MRGDRPDIPNGKGAAKFPGVPQNPHIQERMETDRKSTGRRIGSYAALFPNIRLA